MPCSPEAFPARPLHPQHPRKEEELPPLQNKTWLGAGATCCLWGLPCLEGRAPGHRAPPTPASGQAPHTFGGEGLAQGGVTGKTVPLGKSLCSFSES